MASSVMRIKWSVMRSLSRQKAEVLGLVFIFAVFCMIGSFVWQASQPPDGTYIDLSERRQLELFEDLKIEKQRQESLFEQQRKLGGGRVLEEDEKLLKGRINVPRDIREESNDDFNITKHLDKFLALGGASHGKKKPKPKDFVSPKPKMKEKFIKFYDPSSGKMVMKPAIVEETELEGGPGHCTVYDLRTNVTDEFECMTMSVRPLTNICLYPESQDIHISRFLRNEGIWEPHIVKDFQNILYGDPDLAVIDIGANIGVYTLLAAQMGHQVIAVEPYLENIKRLQKAAQLGNLVDKITVLQNVVSDVTGNYYLKLDATNQGGVSLQMENPVPDCLEKSCKPPQVYGVHMDDLLEVITFTKAVLKIDIEGHEHKAFLHCTKLLDKVYVPFIFMEWMKLREYYGAEITTSEDKDLTGRLVTFLHSKGYEAYSSVTMEKLSPGFWFGWTDDIVWKHNLREFN